MQNNQAIPFNKENFKEVLSREFAWVIIVSIPGAFIADFFNVPLAWFLGPMLVTSVVTLGGVKTKMPRLVLSTVLIFLGLYIGNYVDKSLFSQIHQWAWTSLIMLAYIIISVLLVSKYLQKFSGYGKKTSVFSAAPGALGPLLILAEDEKSDLSQVATAHLIRLIIIITVFPFIVNSFHDTESIQIIESMVASGFLQITEIASYKLPANIIDYCLLILGASVGCRFADKTFKEVAKNTVHSFVATLLLVLLGLAAAIVAGYVIDKNFFTLLLSYCPGGIYEVAVIAIFFDLDPEFVSFHHIIRLLMILFVVPLILKFIYKNKKPT